MTNPKLNQCPYDEAYKIEDLKKMGFKEIQDLLESQRSVIKILNNRWKKYKEDTPKPNALPVSSVEVADIRNKTNPFMTLIEALDDGLSDLVEKVLPECKRSMNYLNKANLFDVEDRETINITPSTPESNDSVVRAVERLDLHIENLESYMNYHDMMKIDGNTFMKLCKEVAKIKSILQNGRE